MKTATCSISILAILLGALDLACSASSNGSDPPSAAAPAGAAGSPSGDPCSLPCLRVGGCSAPPTCSDAGANEAALGDSSSTPAPDGGEPPIHGDAAPSDAAPDVPAPPACKPLTSYTPKSLPSPVLQLPSCPNYKIDTTYDACFDPKMGSPYNCDIDAQDNQGCHDCIMRSSGDGPIIFVGTAIMMNRGGCIQLLDSAHAACGKAVAQFDDCIATVCGPCGLDPACEATATAGVCKTFADAADCSNALQGGPADTCLYKAGEAFFGYFDSVAGAFCR